MGTSCQLSEVEQLKLQQWTSAHGTPQQVALRCRIVLAAAAGEPDVTIAKRLAVNRNTVILWRKRFGDEGLDGLWDIAPGRGRKPTYQIDKIAGIVDATLQTKPAGMTHWSCRTMAQSQGVSKSTVNNIWRAHNLQPHRTETFKLSRDPKFLEKMTDVVGLYLNPPQQAIVLCVDEKSQIQALDRTQPGLPIKKGRCGTMTHDYKRNGTTTLFAALETLQGPDVCDDMEESADVDASQSELDTSALAFGDCKVGVDGLCPASGPTSFCRYDVCLGRVRRHQQGRHWFICLPHVCVFGWHGSDCG